MKQSPLLKFKSSAFAVISGEDEETNPGIYGKALAGWLCGQLRLAGVVAEDVIAEDFGWCVPVKSPPSCANDEAADHWQIFTFVERRLMDRIFGKDKSTELLAPLHATVRRCLESSAVVHGLHEEAVDGS